MKRTRPGDRPLRRLPQLEERKATLERCVFCPKLCRSACPVSNAEPRETVTPWGKMSTAYFVANESVAYDPAFAAPAWACTGCYGCREHCDHHNDVTGTLYDARSAMKDLAPEGAKRVLREFSAEARSEAMRMERAGAGGTALLVGCRYERAAAEDAALVVTKLAGGATVVDECCGAPLLYAGDRARFEEQGRRLRARFAKVVAVDAGCGMTARQHGVEVEHLSTFVARSLDRLGQVAVDGPVRWHDPCQLGRGMGVYDEPRQILAAILGRPADEFTRTREDARCSGAGGLLPVTKPETAQAIGAQRLADHERSGGGTIVTACASSARAFRKQGARVIDLASLTRRALA